MLAHAQATAPLTLRVAATAARADLVGAAATSCARSAGSPQARLAGAPSNCATAPAGLSMTTKAQPTAIA
eukprot:1503631-Lingulodinium_polyedra.AAC.1